MRCNVLRLFLTIVAAAGLSGCAFSPKSPAGFRLPENGDVERGKRAFADLKCQACHTVKGVELPALEPAIAKIIPLGGEVREFRTDGYLVTSIIHPSHKLGGLPRQDVAVEGQSKMPDYTQRMTVRQLVDMVAFLQSTYVVIPPPPVN